LGIEQAELAEMLARAAAENGGSKA